MKNFIKKHNVGIVLGLILIFGAFLRLYHFSDWLHFELDQSRDAIVVDLALKHGIGNLPLLGPKAAGSFLRLGPAFYNLEYLSGLIFGATPSGMAIYTAIFSILSIGLFYLLIKRYFNVKISLALAWFFSISLFLVLYGRFAWNPNALPFFILLSFYALLRTVDGGWYAGRWLVVSVFSLAIATQLHFVAFLGLPTIMMLFLIYKRPNIAWRYWLGSVVIFLALYLPVIINDIKTGGDNISEFKKVFLKKSNAGENTLLEKGIKNYSENALGYLLMVSGYEKAELPRVRQIGASFDFICDKGCRENIVMGGLALAIFSLGIILLLYQMKNSAWKKKNAKADFMVLTLLWFSTTFILFIPIAYDFAPRFFLLISALPFIWLGFIFQFLEENIKNKKIFQGIFISLVLGLSVINLQMVNQRFFQLATARTENFKINTDRILKEEYRVTLEQQELVVNYIESIYAINQFPVYLNSEAFYRRSLLYLLEKRGMVRDDFRSSQLKKIVYRDGNYFLVYPQNVNLENRTKKYLDNYEIVSEKKIGTLVVFQLKPKEEAINAEKQIFEPEKKPRSASGVPVRCRWNEISGKCNPDEAEDAE